MSVFAKMNFDAWSALASDDPQAFERLRKQVISEFLGQIPAAQQSRLRSLQWRIDRVRDRSKNPMSATINLYSMMWDSVAGERGMLAMLENPIQLAEKPPETAEIIDFNAHKN